MKKPKTIRKIVITLLLSVLILTHHENLTWVTERWFYSWLTTYNLFVLGAFLFLIWRTKLWEKIRARNQLEPISLLIGVLIVVLEIIHISQFRESYQIISSLSFVGAFLALFSSFFRLNISGFQKLLWGILTFFLLPLLPLLNNSIGLVIRNVYTKIILWVANTFSQTQTSQNGTSLISEGNFTTHIDETCSGIQGAFILTVACVVWGIWNRKEWRPTTRAYFSTILFFLLLNLIRISTIFYLHNIKNLTGLQTLDNHLGLGILTLSVIFLFWRCKHEK